ncbi:hypothetical protein [Moorena producens]|nr:hypothetical protein [Moorena producens]
MRYTRFFTSCLFPAPCSERAPRGPPPQSLFPLGNREDRRVNRDVLH